MDSISTTLITNNESATSSDYDGAAIEMVEPVYNTTESEYTSRQLKVPAHTTTESEFTNSGKIDTGSATISSDITEVKVQIANSEILQASHLSQTTVERPNNLESSSTTSLNSIQPNIQGRSSLEAEKLRTKTAITCKNIRLILYLGK